MPFLFVIVVCVCIVLPEVLMYHQAQRRKHGIRDEQV